MGNNDQKGTAAGDRLTTEELAALVIDALFRADIVSEAHIERAMKIAVEEIEVRKILGDY